MVDVPAALAVSANDEHDFHPRILALLHCIFRRLKYCSTAQSYGFGGYHVHEDLLEQIRECTFVHLEIAADFKTATCLIHFNCSLLPYFHP